LSFRPPQSSGIPDCGGGEDLYAGEGACTTRSSEGAGGNARASRFFVEEALERRRLPGVSCLPFSFSLKS